MIDKQTRQMQFSNRLKDRISLLLVYPKNEMDNLTADELKKLKGQLIL